MKARLLMGAIGAVALAGLAWGALYFVRTATVESKAQIPAAEVRRGDVTIAVTARGELQGGNSEVLTAPQVGGTDVSITELREPGSLVEPGDVVVQFDTTVPEFALREAQADLGEAEQQVAKAQAEAKFTEEEARYAVLSAQADVDKATLEMRKNPTLSRVAAQQNEISLASAKNRLTQAQEDLKNKTVASKAGIAIQMAGVNKAKAVAEQNQRLIESMSIRAQRRGYVYVQNNSNQNQLYIGQQLPPFQVGDTARAGQAVAQIPDMSSWEVIANIPELDRGHLAVGEKVSIRPAALAGKEYAGHVKVLGGTTGPPWDRRFECRIALDRAGPELRPGMTSMMVITAAVLKSVLWIPSQALFESDGKTFVYLRNQQGFVPKMVQLVRRSESQAVITGLREGDLLALSNPDDSGNAAGPSSGGVMKALTK